MKTNDRSQDRPKPAKSPPVAVEIDELTFEQFGLWIDAELEKLVRRWQSVAAPRAKYPHTGRGFQTLNADKL